MLPQSAAACDDYGGIQPSFTVCYTLFRYSLKRPWKAASSRCVSLPFQLYKFKFSDENFHIGNCSFGFIIIRNENANLVSH